MDFDSVIAFMAHHEEFEKELERICRIIFNARCTPEGEEVEDLFGCVERFEIDNKDGTIFVSCDYKRGNSYADLTLYPTHFQAPDEELVECGTFLRDECLAKIRQEQQKEDKVRLEALEREREALKKRMEEECH